MFEADVGPAARQTCALWWRARAQCLHTFERLAEATASALRRIGAVAAARLAAVAAAQARLAAPRGQRSRQRCDRRHRPGRADVVAGAPMAGGGAPAAAELPTARRGAPLRPLRQGRPSRWMWAPLWTVWLPPGSDAASVASAGSAGEAEVAHALAAEDHVAACGRARCPAMGPQPGVAGVAGDAVRRPALPPPVPALIP